MLFSSGMAAMSSTVLAFAGAGDHVVMLDELYGGTRAFATDLCDRLGITYSFAVTDADAVAQAVTPATKMIVIESPTNPLMGIIDIAQVARIGKERGIVTVIDNTFATPVNQRPSGLGIDIVVHSGTKYMGGHSDLCCGVAVASSQHADTIRHAAKQLGGSVNAVTCSLLERSLKTLAIRVERQTGECLQDCRLSSFARRSQQGQLPRSIAVDRASDRPSADDGVRGDALIRTRRQAHHAGVVSAAPETGPAGSQSGRGRDADLLAGGNVPCQSLRGGASKCRHH